MHTFYPIYQSQHWETVHFSMQRMTAKDVEAALNKREPLSLFDFQALISVAAVPYLEQMAAKSRDITRMRFGKTIQLYIPLYLSNECQNICTYCGFSLSNKMPRKTLSEAEVLAEARVIRSMGYEHILLVTGEDNKLVGVDYLVKAIRLLQPIFSQISIEVQPLSVDEYKRLKLEGVHTVLIYQETYNREAYALHHPKGRKSNFRYRLETPDRIGEAAIHKIGLGTLIGLEDWRTDGYFTAMHLRYMESTYWKSKYSISFPRLRPFSGGIAPIVAMTDRDLVQLICAYRLFSPETDLSLSTRESAFLRNNLVELGITQMSAGSRTDPGGYASADSSLEQFEISDDRTPAEIANMISQKGLDPVWKDWDTVIG